MYFSFCPCTNDEKWVLLFRLVLKPTAFWGSNSCNKVLTIPSATLGRTFYFLAHMKPSPVRNSWSLFILSPSSLLYFPKLYLPEILPDLGIFYCLYEEEEGSSLQSLHLAHSEADERKQTVLCCTVTVWWQDLLLNTTCYTVCSKE